MGGDHTQPPPLGCFLSLVFPFYEDPSFIWVARFFRVFLPTRSRPNTPEQQTARPGMDTERKKERKREKERKKERKKDRKGSCKRRGGE